MRKLFVIVLVFSLVFPIVSFAEYHPALGMTIQEFIDAFSAASNPLNIEFNDNMRVKKWPSPLENIKYAYLNPCRDGTLLKILSNDPDFDHNMNAGVDSITFRAHIPDRFISLIAIADRCQQIFQDRAIIIFSHDDYYCFTVQSAGDVR